MFEEFWALRRKQYRVLAELCVLIDDAISQITFLSFANSLFFIAKQLLWSMRYIQSNKSIVIDILYSNFLMINRPMPSIPHAIYFWFSLIFIILRTLAVSLYSAEIYDQSKKPIEVLRDVPNSSWCAEVRRFSEQVVNDTIALTGMRFFVITRKLILTVCCKIYRMIVKIVEILIKKNNFLHFLGYRHNYHVRTCFSTISK